MNPTSLTSPTSHYLRCCEREIHYTAWGDEHLPPLIMWHGLARTGRDFDDIAAALADTYRIICPDTIGRGYSQWSPDPDNEYCLAFYAQLARELLDQLGFDRVRWVGTSMGGAIGTKAGATTLKDRITHLVLNDNGPALAQPAIERIKAYAGNPPQFATVTELEAFYRTVYKPFGWMSDAQWRRLAETSTRRLPDGKVTPHYDPAMVRQFFAHPDDYALWPEYDALGMPVLVLRGAESDLLLQETAEEMTRRGPKAELAVIAGCGHAPALNVPEQIELVRRFLAHYGHAAADSRSLC
jgi:pimeloyl-ACP methyl ester carboxylesterase